jgi:hypothetical protein
VLNSTFSVVDERGAILFALAQAVAGLDDRVEQRRARARHGEHLADAVMQLFLIRRVVAKDGRPIGDADDGDRPDALERLHERGQGAANFGDVIARGLGIVDEDG